MQGAALFASASGPRSSSSTFSPCLLCTRTTHCYCVVLLLLLRATSTTTAAATTRTAPQAHAPCSSSVSFIPQQVTHWALNHPPPPRSPPHSPPCFAPTPPRSSRPSIAASSSIPAASAPNASFPNTCPAEVIGYLGGCGGRWSGGRQQRGGRMDGAGEGAALGEPEGGDAHPHGYSPQPARRPAAAAA